MIVDKSHMKKQRVFAGLSQAQLAEKAGIHPSAVSQLEAGSIQGSAATVKRIAEVLKIDVEKLYVVLEG
jgi:transcriptional regulator with XRE-family HTH domain